jgi:Ran GTPase-activating protein (RanGAP) involved in mRNA processing and transport
MAILEPDNAYAYTNPYESDVQKLGNLKEECMGCAPTLYYGDPVKVAEMFKDRCDEWLNHILPDLDTSKEGQENGAHASFQAARTAMYVQSNRDQVSELDVMILNPEKLITCLEGGSGSGKSALIANFHKAHPDVHPDNTVIAHYIGCSSDSTDLGLVIRRLIALLDGKEGIMDTLPEGDKVGDLTKLFHTTLAASAAKQAKKKGTTLIIIIDALSQLDQLRYEDNGYRYSSHDLEWLPPVGSIPPNVRFLVSSLRGVALERIKKRTDVECRHMLPLHKNERRDFCNKVLEKAGKTLKKTQLSRIMYGESYFMAGGGNTKKGMTYVVKGAGYSRVNGRYVIESGGKEDDLEEAKAYIKTDDNRYRLERIEGVWKLNTYYRCPHGTDTPPSLGWTPTEEGYKPFPTIRCLQPPTHNPLFLKLAMEELVAFGSFELLDDKIQEIASCGSIPTLLLLMLDRLEMGFETSHPGAIRTIFSQIWCCKNGMTATELCQLCNIEEGEESTEWGILFTAVTPFLVARSGRYTFLHAYIKQAVQARYCPTTGHRWAVASIQFYFFYPHMRNPDATKEKKERATEELRDLSRFIDAKVLHSDNLEAHTTELDFANNNVGGEVAKAIGQGLGGNETLVKMNLTGNNIMDKGCQAITAALQQNHTLVYLDLSNNGITNKGAKSIGQAMQTNDTLEHLDVSNNRIAVEGAKAIGKGVSSTQSMKTLICSGNRFGSEGAKGVATALKSNETITEFHLEDNNIGEEGALAIGVALQHNRGIRRLRLGRNALGDAGCFAVFDAAKQNPMLEEIHVDENEMSVKGAEAVNDLLLNCTTLLFLNMRNNTLGAEGCAALAPALAKNTTLVRLNLSYNSIDDQGARSLGEALDRNTGLQVLDLSYNQIGDNGIHGLAQALHCSNSDSMQKYLRLWKNETGYLKQWKNRNQLGHGKGGGEDGEGAEGVDGEDKKKMATRTLDQLAVDLTNMAKLKTEEKLIRKPGGISGLSRTGDGNVKKKKKGTREIEGVDKSKDEKKEKKVEVTDMGSSAKVSAITDLDLSFNSFGSDGAKSIGSALQSNSSVLRLWLTNNAMSDEASETIFTALQVNTSVLELHVGNCNCGDESMKALGQALKDNTSVQYVDASDNNITAEGIVGMLHHWENNTSLKRLNLAGNEQVGEKAARLIGNALMDKNDSIMECKLTGVPKSLAATIDGLLEINGSSFSMLKKQKLKRTKAFKMALKKKVDGEVDDLADMMATADLNGTGEGGDLAKEGSTMADDAGGGAAADSDDEDEAKRRKKKGAKKRRASKVGK